MYSFPLEDQEQILKKSLASLHVGSEAWTGAFYLTTDRVVFIGYLMDISRKYMEEVPLTHVAAVEGGKTFYVFPNVVNIRTIRGRQINVIVNGRDEWLAAIRRRLKELD